MPVDLQLILYISIVLYGFSSLIFSLFLPVEVNTTANQVQSFILLFIACILPLPIWSRLHSKILSLHRSLRIQYSTPFYLPFLFPTALITTITGYVILALVSKLSFSFLTDYFTFKGAVFGGIGWFRYLEDFVFLSLFSSIISISNRTIRNSRYLLFFQLPHLIFLGHRGIILNMIVICLIVKKRRYLYLSTLVIFLKSLKLYKPILNFIIITILLALIFLLPNLSRENDTNLLEFLSLSAQGYFPFQFIYQDLTQSSLSPDQLVSIKDILLSLAAYPFLAFYKVILPSPSNAVNFALNDLAISHMAWTPIHIQGGVTPGILAEAAVLSTSTLSFLYLIALPIFFCIALMSLGLWGLEVSIFANSLSVGFLFTPFNVFTTLFWMYLILHILAIFSMSIRSLTAVS